MNESRPESAPAAAVHTPDQLGRELELEADARRVTLFIFGTSATVLFVVLRLYVALGGHEPLAVDVWWDNLMLSTLSEEGIIVAWIPGIVGGTLGMIIVALLVLALFVWRGRRSDAATLAIATVAVVAVGAPMAAVIARVRPPESLAESVPTSFPSGHTAVATTFAIVLGLLLRRWYVWVLGASWVIVMMWSRTYLHAHWLSDVAAGLLEGIAVACMAWCVIEALRDRRATRAR